MHTGLGLGWSLGGADADRLSHPQDTFGAQLQCVTGPQAVPGELALEDLLWGPGAQPWYHLHLP